MYQVSRDHLIRNIGAPLYFELEFLAVFRVFDCHE